MKWENRIYLLAFLSGVICINMFGTTTLANNSMLSRYNLAALSFQQIVFEEYFFNVLFLRLRTVFVLWIASGFFPKKAVVFAFACIMCSLMGGIIALSIMANGLWGIWFCLCAFFPHGICYGVVYVMWKNLCLWYGESRERKEKTFMVAIMMVLMGIGSMLEAYVCPVLLQNIIKY